MNKKGKIAVVIGTVAGVISGFVLGKYWERLKRKIAYKLLGLGGTCDPFESLGYRDCDGYDFDDYDDYNGCDFEDYDEDEEYPPIPEVDAEELEGLDKEDLEETTEEEETEEEKNRH